MAEKDKTGKSGLFLGGEPIDDVRHRHDLRPPGDDSDDKGADDTGDDKSDDTGKDDKSDDAGQDDKADDKGDDGGRDDS